MIIVTIILLLFSAQVVAGSPENSTAPYEVLWEGSANSTILSILQASSSLITLRDSPPATEAGLQHRAEADRDALINVLHGQGFYGATIRLTFDFKKKPPQVTFIIDQGPIFTIQQFVIRPVDGTVLPEFCPKSIDHLLGTAALPKTIIKAEETFLENLTKQGYPFAKIQKREVLADPGSHHIFVTLYVDSGPSASFGPTTIKGAENVQDSFFTNKIAWKEGERYNPKQIERTQRALEASGLFSSIAVLPSEDSSPDGVLPMQIEVSEGKHRSIGWGFGYNTQRGPGVMAEWEHRNIRGCGEKLRADTDLWPDRQEVQFSYITPDYHRPGQDLIWLTEFRHETTKGYTETSFNLGRLIERQINDRIRLSYGLLYKRLHDGHAENNGTFDLVKSPFNLRWNSTDDLLNPSYGSSIHFKAIPSVQVTGHPFAYCTNTFSSTMYYPLTTDKNYVLANKLLLGSIWGSNHRTIPSSEMFYEGTDSTLRGYRYMTVSPLDHDNKPVGGRSLFVFSTELRVRATENFGWVAFYEIGNVYGPPMPQFDRKLLQCVGWGLRYYTPVVPLRADIAVPLNPRPGLDRRFEFYLSVGHAF